ncbi:hypothetical protein GC387_01440 [Pseudomonas sp. MWU12-2323]|nr:hypothetical protein [Pseudomonas sp. MWU12-2323]
MCERPRTVGAWLASDEALKVAKSFAGKPCSYKSGADHKLCERPRTVGAWLASEEALKAAKSFAPTKSPPRPHTSSRPTARTKTH